MLSKFNLQPKNNHYLFYFLIVEIAEELINLVYMKDIIIDNYLSLKKANKFKTIKNKKWGGRIFIGFYRRNNLKKINNFIEIFLKIF